MFSFNIEMNLNLKKSYYFCLMKMEYFIFKVEKKKDGRRDLFGMGSLYKSWQCFRGLCAFSFLKNKRILWRIVLASI